MTDIQLYLSIGIPVIANAAFFGLLMMYINSRIDSVNARIDGVDSRIDGVNTRIDGVNTKFDTKFDSLNTKIDSLSTRFDIKFDGLRNEMNARFEAAHQGLLRVEGVIDARLKHLEANER